MLELILWALLVVAAFAVLNLGWFRLYLRCCFRVPAVVLAKIIPIDSYRRFSLPASHAH